MYKIKKMKLLNVLSLVVFSIISQNIYSQETESTEYPSDYGTYTIPLWSKAVLELKEMDNKKFEYRILCLENYENYYSFNKPTDLFANQPLKNTVEIFFVGAYYNEGNDDKDYRTVLILRNNLEKPINYNADIKYYYNEDFENTSIVGAFPNVKTTEIWQHKIDLIALYDFRVLKRL
jgi:hypothetical protein